MVIEKQHMTLDELLDLGEDSYEPFLLLIIFSNQVNHFYFLTNQARVIS